jgi:hypothetical protein
VVVVALAGANQGADVPRRHGGMAHVADKLQTGGSNLARKESVGFFQWT